jgi:hypothetical protein
MGFRSSSFVLNFSPATKKSGKVSVRSFGNALGEKNGNDSLAQRQGLDK